MIFLFIACGQKDSIPVDDGLITEPHQRLTTATMRFYEKGMIRWLLDTDYMERPLEDVGDMFVVPVRISVFDTAGVLSTRILSDSGRSNHAMEIFNLYGNVQIENSDGITVKSEQLMWNRVTRHVTSNTFVQIETEKGDVLRGRGLDALDDFSRFSFESDISGVFPDFRQRVEAGDESFL